MRYYKVLKGNKAKDGGCFDYTKYLPKKKGSVGKWLPVIKKVEECSRGYHVTNYWNMWYNDGCEVWEVEPKGIVKKEEVGVIDKFVCKSFRFLKRVHNIKIDKKNNAGDFNAGDFNAGDYNAGDHNAGDLNTGHRNAGHRNAGDYNAGHHNAGDYNAGDLNTGHYNTGHHNAGHRNAGDHNAGDLNTGHRNTGYRNTGQWNTANKQTGCLNTKPPEYIEMFNKPIKKEVYDKITFPDYFYFGLDHKKTYKQCWIESFKKATKKEIQQTIKLPNFDYEVFKEITGITKKMMEKKLK